MAANEIIAQLGGWDGYEVAGGGEEQRGDARWCVIRLRPLGGGALDRRRQGRAGAVGHSDAGGRRAGADPAQGEREMRWTK